MEIKARNDNLHASLLTAQLQRARNPMQNQKLQSIDSAVKVHEKTHLAILGGYAAGTISYDTLLLPDGSKFAVGGSIGVDTQPVPGDPAATLRKARIIRMAALAPNTPSGADMKVAAAAYRMEMQARQELTEKEEASYGPDAKLINPMAKDGSFTAEMPALVPVPVPAPVPGDPQATIRKARTIRNEAMQGSLTAGERQLIVKAYQMEQQARRELAANKEKLDLYA